MRVMRILAMVIASLLVSNVSSAVMFKWKDSDGNIHATDRMDKLPQKYRNIVRDDVDHYVTPGGIGFERDLNGNFNFFDHSSPAKTKTESTRKPPEREGAPGMPVTPQQLADVKRRYAEWGGEPRPDVMEAKVMRIISADTFELENGQKVTYIGIEFPHQMKGDTEIHREAIEYQKKLMLGRTVGLVFGPQRFDDMGRMLAFVFVGKDMFVNADLVMNGYAKVHTVKPNTEYRKLFLRLENFAKRSMLGIWDPGKAGPE